MNKAIPSNQLAYSAAAFIMAAVLLTSNLYQFAGNSSWVSVLIGFAVSLLIVGLYGRLTKRYPGMSLPQINGAVFGRVAGKIVTVLYIFYFLSLAVLNTRDLGDFIASSVLRQTPRTLIFIVFILLCAWAVRKGPVNMTRYAFLATAVSIGAVLTNTLFLADKYNPQNLLPAFTLPARNYLIGAHIVTMLPFCEILAFTMFIPHMYRPPEFGRAMRKGLIIAAVMLLIVVLRDTVVLGKFITVLSMPSYDSARYINIGDVLTRVEIIYAIVLVALLFFKVSVVYYAGASGLRQLFETQSYRPYVYILGALICLYAAASFPTNSEHVRWRMTTAATFSTFFILVLPLLTLLVSLIREGVSTKEKVSGTQ